jgi:hypothetical protein
VLLQFALVVCRLILVYDAFRGKAVEVGFGVVEKRGRLISVFFGAQFFEQRTHPAPVKSVTGPAPGVLPHPLFC